MNHQTIARADSDAHTARRSFTPAHGTWHMAPGTGHPPTTTDRMLKLLRITLLLALLVFVALNTLLDRSLTRSWKAPLQVALYPVNGDGSTAAARAVQSVDAADLQQLSEFFATEAEHYQLPLQQPFRFVWGPALGRVPPLPPTDRSLPAVMQWSLKLRWFRWRTPDPPGPTPIIKLYVLFNDPAGKSVLPDSTGLSKGLVGLAQVFAGPEMRRANLVIIAHELLHTLTATDKYDADSLLPVFPDGYAEPDNEPLHPQVAAELMAGRIALSAREAVQPSSLSQVMIGRQTAIEIGWLTP